MLTGLTRGTSPSRATVVPFASPDFARSLFDENGDALFLINPLTDQILDANDTAIRLTGFDRAELVSRKVIDLFLLDVQKQPDQQLIRGATEKTTVFHGKGGFQMRIRREPGWLPVTVTITRLHIKPQTVALFTVRDDTDRRVAIARAHQAEADVRQSEERFRALVEKSSDGIAVMNAQGIVLYASPSIHRVLGYSPLLLQGRDPFFLVHPEELATFRMQLERLVRQPQNDLTVIHRFLHADGRWRSIDIIAHNRIDDSAVNGLVIHLRDVTEREHAQAELHRQHAILQTVLDSVPDVITHKDDQLRFLSGNAAFERFIGKPIDSVVGSDASSMLTAPWASACQAKQREVVQSGVATHAEITVPAKDAAEVLIDFTFAPVREGNRITGVVTVGRDISSRRLLEAQLRQSQKMEAIGQLAGGVAHDFNNLLTVILGNLELLQELYREKQIRELIEPTERAARRASELVSQLLGFARRTPMEFRPINPADLIRETASLLQRTISPRIKLQVHPRPNSWYAFADCGQLNQVLMNLCINARDAIPNSGHITLSSGNVDVTADHAARNPQARVGEFVRLRVQDTGTGMTPAVLSHIFEPFFTTKEPGQGTGLGLAVVFGIVDAHQGWIECQSEAGFGTTFEVYLPRYQGDAMSTPTPTPTPSPLGQGERILIADDEPMIRQLASTVLTHLGYQVTAVADGAAAVEAATFGDAKFDLVLLDLTMPRMGGLEALDAIRARWPHIPVIIASGYSNDRFGAMLPNVTFLDKPFSPTVLGRTVRQVLETKAQT
jgi:two-component system, cell cycle sensor histidine kinase and response regulator CckA